MTSIKEALERIKRTALDAKPEDVPKALAHIVRLCIDADRTTVESGDARERIARAVTSEFEQMYKDGVPMCMREGETTWRTYYAGFDLSMFANRIVNAILAIDLVPDEAAKRFWLELREPNRVPEWKGPFQITRLAETLREFMAARPSAFITVVTWHSSGPAFEDAPSELMMADARSRSTARRHIETSKTAHASHREASMLAEKDKANER